MVIALEPPLQWLIMAGIAWYGGKAAVATGQALHQHMANSSASDPAAQSQNAEDRADEDLSDSDKTDACSTCLKPPNKRHDPCKTTGVAKDKNTMIDPDYAGQVKTDVGQIQQGNVTPSNGTYTVNGSTYGFHDNILYPQSGPGFVDFSRPQVQLNGQLNTNTFDNAMKFADALRNKGIISQEQIDQVLRLWKKCKK